MLVVEVNQTETARVNAMGVRPSVLSVLMQWVERKLAGERSR